MQNQAVVPDEKAVLEEKRQHIHGKKLKTIPYDSFKRLLDMLFGLMGCMFFCIILPFVALAIKLDSKGPVFFLQERVGKNFRLFKVFKFRTMVLNAEDLRHLVQAEERIFIQTDDDPRCTWVGQFLRNWSIDELPQIFNVLKGEMSIVGPRPYIISEIIRCDEVHLQRLLIKPGMTGLAQVYGRNLLDANARMEKDLYYVENRSLWLDIKILVRTVLVVLRRDGVS